MELVPSISGSPLPPLYARWIDELLKGPIPEETEATCSDCAMCESPGEHIAGEHFNSHTKCCTYLPELFNFLVGRILSDDDPTAAKGRATVEERLQRGAGVTPLGLGKSRPYQLLYRNSVDSFGHSSVMRCPHFIDAEGGQCGVWKHRMSMCATWFCKHVRGHVGQHFWKAVHRLLATVERGLSAWCVLELDPGRESLEKLFRVHTGAAGDDPLTASELDGTIDPAHYRGVWGRWLGREVEFYRACADKVNALSWSDVVALCGPDLRVAAHLVMHAYRDLCSDALPPVLKLGPFQVVASDAESVRVASYSPYDPLELPRALLEVLHRFDGRPLDDVLETIASGDGIEIERDLVRKLADFQILEPPA